MWKLLHIIFPTPRFFRWFLDGWEICGPLFWDPFGYCIRIYYYIAEVVLFVVFMMTFVCIPRLLLVVPAPSDFWSRLSKNIGRTQVEKCSISSQVWAHFAGVPKYQSVVSNKTAACTLAARSYGSKACPIFKFFDYSFSAGDIVPRQVVSRSGTRGTVFVTTVDFFYFNCEIRDCVHFLSSDVAT